MPTPFVKICGLSTPESVDCAVEHGADAVGFVFADSVRRVTPEQARALAARVPDGKETVGVFRSQPIDEVIETARAAKVTTIQFHGYEPLGDVKRAQAEGFRTLRAFGIDEFAGLDAATRESWATERVLIDAVEPGGGVPFDVDQLDRDTLSGWWLLAGGLTPENVASLISRLRPRGVDVSSGVEKSRGVKSLSRIAAFIAAAKRS
jgi:phosphoribosylanthranilate isomerase